MSKAVPSRKLTRNILGIQSKECCVGACNDREGGCYQAVLGGSAQMGGAVIAPKTMRTALLVILSTASIPRAREVLPLNTAAEEAFMGK